MFSFPRAWVVPMRVEAPNPRVASNCSAHSVMMSTTAMVVKVRGSVTCVSRFPESKKNETSHFPGLWQIYGE